MFWCVKKKRLHLIQLYLFWNVFKNTTLQTTIETLHAKRNSGCVSVTWRGREHLTCTVPLDRLLHWSSSSSSSVAEYWASLLFPIQYENLALLERGVKSSVKRRLGEGGEESGQRMWIIYRDADAFAVILRR